MTATPAAPGDPPVPPALGAVRITRVTGGGDLDHYRAVRLAMLLDSPRAFASTYAGTVAHPSEWWAERVRSSPVWLAWHGDRPVGSVGMGWHEECGPDGTGLIGMWVAPPARGSGVGEALVTTVLDAARVEGRRRVVLDVAEENAPARRLYERMGFRPTGGTWFNPEHGGVPEVEYEHLLTEPAFR